MPLPLPPPVDGERKALPGEKFLYGGLSNALSGARVPAHPARVRPMHRAASTAQPPTAASSPDQLHDRTGVTTNPMDVLKVRLQMQNELAKQLPPGAAGTPPPPPPPRPQLGLLGMARAVVAAEGPRALMNGWQASVQREMTYSSIRMGLYDEVKALIAGALNALGWSQQQRCGHCCCHYCRHYCCCCRHYCCWCCCC